MHTFLATAREARKSSLLEPQFPNIPPPSAYIGAGHGAANRNAGSKVECTSAPRSSTWGRSWSSQQKCRLKVAADARLWRRNAMGVRRRGTERVRAPVQDLRGLHARTFKVGAGESAWFVEANARSPLQEASAAKWSRYRARLDRRIYSRRVAQGSWARQDARKRLEGARALSKMRR